MSETSILEVEPLVDVPNRLFCPKCETYKNNDNFGKWTGQKYDKSPYCIPCNKQIDRAKDRESRLETLKIYGGVCVACGRTDDTSSRYTKLEVDHIKTDGFQDRKTMSTSSLKRHIAQLGHKDKTRELQLLCKNCHDTKTFSDLPNWKPAWRRSTV